MDLKSATQSRPALASPTLAGTALTLIHAGRAATRSELTSRLGVTRATTGAITAELRELGLIVVDSGPGGGQQGRPSHRVVPDPEGPVAVAVQVHPDGYAVALVGLGGVIAARRAWPAPVPADPGLVFAGVAEAAAELLRASGRRCVGAAACLPTAVTRPQGTAIRALYVGWPDGSPVRDLFAAELARSGVIAPAGCSAVNDVNAIALAEHRHGAGRDAGHLLVVVAEHRGVGGGLVLDGGLYTGSSGLAMEAGHVSVDPYGRPCVCGNRGCLNVETDAARFLESAGRELPAEGPILDEAIALLLDGYHGDERVRAAADEIVARLGLGLAGLINVLNPDRVLLGGMFSALLAVAPGRLREAVARHSPWGHGAAIPVEACALDEAGLIGAAEIAWQPVLDNPALLRTLVDRCN